MKEHNFCKAWQLIFRANSAEKFISSVLFSVNDAIIERMQILQHYPWTKRQDFKITPIT